MVLPPYVQNLTIAIDVYIKKKQQTTPAEVEHLFWSDIDKILNAPNKEEILHQWKYGTSFKLTESKHADGAILFGNKFTWEQSFIIGLLMFCFH